MWPLIQQHFYFPVVLSQYALPDNIIFFFEITCNWIFKAINLCLKHSYDKQNQILHLWSLISDYWNLPKSRFISFIWYDHSYLLCIFLECLFVLLDYLLNVVTVFCKQAEELQNREFKKKSYLSFHVSENIQWVWYAHSNSLQTL